MIKRIPVTHLKVGMYVSDLNRDWIPHNNLKKQGILKNEQVIEKISSLGIQEIYIDTSRGLDCDAGLTQPEVDQQNQRRLQTAGEAAPAIQARVALTDEMDNALMLHQQAKGLVNQVMADVKIKKAIDVHSIESLADGMLESIFRNHNALSALGRIRDKDSYLMEHSVNLSVLMSVFGKSIRLGRDVLQQTIIGALLHDIGKILVPDSVLHKAGKLTEREFSIIKLHAAMGRDILKVTQGVSELSIKIVSEHHERMDGTGYPEGLKADQISTYGRMTAIVDVYDAITADRCYHKGMTPTQGIAKLLEWCDFHLDRGLVNQFIRCIGIYPVGSLVLLESGRLGVVIEANEFEQRLPTVRVMYHTKFRAPIKVEVIDLSLPKVQDRIVKAVDPRDYKIDIKQFLV
ncbi:MAG: HD-GYP domain-containing protein [Hahellaceae bacterium]|nr:HD-GYP domain-containing protein [Hahellaceae bacterium]